MADQAPRLDEIDILKGISILAVVGLHVLSSLDSTLFTTSPHRLFFIGLNQALRFSVPLFVAISGYLLSQKYSKQPFNIVPYLTKRVLTLVPLYVFWSAIITLVLSLYEGSTIPSLSLEQLVTGKPDYHLYFVPMMLVLYFIFPIILKLSTINRFLPLSIALIIQLARYQWITGQVETPGLITLTDHAQYLHPFSWIFYFSLGTFLVRPLNMSKKNASLFLLGILATWYWSWQRSAGFQTSGIDIIITSRFTTLPVMLYAALIIMLTLSLPNLTTILPTIMKAVLRLTGRHSYLIFLSHTLLLRILINPSNSPLGTQLQSTVIILSGLYLSKILLKYLNGCQINRPLVA
jgi:probable poly-beta-1,6-N-acetyl-D-glucosamine export protein